MIDWHEYSWSHYYYGSRNIGTIKKNIVSIKGKHPFILGKSNSMKWDKQLRNGKNVHNNQEVECTHVNLHVKGLWLEMSLWLHLNSRLEVMWLSYYMYLSKCYIWESNICILKKHIFDVRWRNYVIIK